MLGQGVNFVNDKTNRWVNPFFNYKFNFTIVR